MITKKFKIEAPQGLHLRPAGTFCKECIKYKSYITLKFKNNEYNAKSVLSVLAACVREGDEIELSFNGNDEEEAVKGVTKMIEEINRL